MNNIPSITLATTNQGKWAEFVAMWQAVAKQKKTQHLPTLKALAEYDRSRFLVDENGASFIENALIKARYAAELIQGPVLADDSGICVAALDGAPGIFSARYSGPGATDQANIDKLLQALAAVPADQRAAEFRCALVYLAGPTATPIIAEARWPGEIVTEQRGVQGFGYDPVFYLPEQQCTAAQLPNKLKNTLSHRAMALADLFLQTGWGLK